MRGFGVAPTALALSADACRSDHPAQAFRGVEIFRSTEIDRSAGMALTADTYRILKTSHLAVLGRRAEPCPPADTSPAPETFPTYGISSEAADVGDPTAPIVATDPFNPLD
jgi:hypothetical protein